MKTKIIKYPIVEVGWFDAQSSNESWTIKEIKELVPLLSFSVGYLLHQDKEKLIVGSLLFENENIKHFQVIPKGMIKNVKYLRLKIK